MTHDISLQAGAAAGTRLQVVPATADRWADLERVFAGRGDPGRCWCQWFFDAPVAAGEVAAANQAALRSQVESGLPPGVLAYSDLVPVGWCAVAPRRGYSRLQRAEALRGVRPDEFEDQAVWAVTCFVVPAADRRRGVASALLRGAVAFAAGHGARVVEAYPVDVTAKASTSSAELFHGPLSIFLRAGFTETGRPRPARPVVRLQVGAGS